MNPFPLFILSVILAVIVSMALLLFNIVIMPHIIRERWGVGWIAMFGVLDICLFVLAGIVFFDLMPRAWGVIGP